MTDSLLLSGLLNHWGPGICFSISCLNLKQRVAGTTTTKRISDQQQNQNNILLFPSFLFGSRGTLANSHLQFVFSSLFWANSITDPHSAACAAHACWERAVMFPSFLPKIYFSGTTTALVFPALQSSTYHPVAAEAAAPPPTLRRQGRPGAPGSAATVRVRVRAQDSPIRPKLSDKVLRNFFILLIFSADCESIMSHMGGDPPRLASRDPRYPGSEGDTPPFGSGTHPLPHGAAGRSGTAPVPPGEEALHRGSAGCCCCCCCFLTRRRRRPAHSPVPPPPPPLP